MTDADRTELIEALVRLATGYEQALVLVDKALGVSGPQKRLTAGDWRVRVARRRRVGRS